MLLVERDRLNRKIGERSGLVRVARQNRFRFSVEKLPAICTISSEDLKSIYDAIDAHPDWDDEDVAENVVF